MDSNNLSLEGRALATVDQLEEDFQDLQIDNDDEEDSDGDADDMEGLLFLQDQRTFRESMTSYAELLEDFAKGLRYQIQFNDRRMLATIEREGTVLLRLIENCLDRERRANDARCEGPLTWECSTTNAMFWRPRPCQGD